MGRDVIEQVAMVMGRIVHAGTGEAPVGRVAVSVAEGPVWSRILDDGTFVVSGHLPLLFAVVPGPPYTVHLRIRADSPQYRQGFVAQDRTVTVPAGWDFLRPWDAGTITLPADPVTIRGRVVEGSDPSVAVANARVELLPSGAFRMTPLEGTYRFDNVTVAPTDQIRCRLGTRTVTRPLRVDFTRAFHEEYFRLP